MSEAGVYLEGTLLKPQMIMAGVDAPEKKVRGVNVNFIIKTWCLVHDMIPCSTQDSVSHLLGKKIELMVSTMLYSDFK